MERVVITGMGAITPVGNDVPTFWESLKTGKCGIGPITKFDVSDFKVKLGAEVKDFDPTQYMEKREARRADANVHYAMAAAIQAVEQAGLKEGNFDPYRTGVIFGSGVGGLHVAEQEVPKLLEKGPGRVSPFAIPEMIANIAAAYISMHFGREFLPGFRMCDRQPFYRRGNARHPSRIPGRCCLRRHGERHHPDLDGRLPEYEGCSHGRRPDSSIHPV